MDVFKLQDKYGVEFRGLDQLDWTLKEFSAIFQKGDNVDDFPFASRTSP